MPATETALDEEPRSPAEILAALETRLAEQKSSGQPLELNAQTLPAGLPENPAQVLRAIRDHLGVQRLVFATDAKCALSPDSLRLTGQARLLGVEGVDVIAIFTAENSLLKLALTAVMPMNYRLGHSWPALATKELDALPLADVQYVLNTQDCGQLTLTAGLKLPARLGYRSSARLPAPPPKIVKTSGRIQNSEKGPLFRLESQGELPLLDIRLGNRGSLSLQVQGIFIARQSAPEGHAPAISSGFNGIVESFTPGPEAGPLVAARQEVSLDLPTPALSRVTLTLSTPETTTLGNIFDLVAGAASHAALLPPSMRSLEITALSKFAISLPVHGLGPTVISAALDLPSGSSWPFAAGELPLKNLSFAVEASDVRYYPNIQHTSFKATLRGTLTLADTAYAVTLSVPGKGDWMLAFSDPAHTPALDVLAHIVGASETAVAGAFPSFLSGPLSVSITEAAIWGDPFAGGQALKGVTFTVAQTQPQVLVPGIASLANWRADIQLKRLANGSWDPLAALAVVQGEIVLGDRQTPSATAAVAMVLPAASGAPLEISLAEGTLLHLPALGKLTELLPVNSGLPAGLDKLGGIEVRQLSLAIDLAEPRLVRLNVAAKQAGSWSLLGGNIKVRDIDVALTYRPGGFPVTGHIRGLFSVCRTEVGVNLRRESSADGWRLMLADSGVRISSLDSLDRWLEPNYIRRALPDTPPFKKGMLFRGLELNFDAQGLPRSVAFGLELDHLWTLIDDKLSMDSVSAEMTMPWPIKAHEIHGNVSAMLKLGGAVFALSAQKPQAGVNWVLTAQLQETYDVDLVHAANEVSSSQVQLPAELADFLAASSSPILSIETASVSAIPETGEFHFEGAAKLKEWPFQFGAGTSLTMASLKGRIDLPAKGKEPRAYIEGRLSFASLSATVALDLGGSGQDTVLSATLTAEQSTHARLGDIAEELAKTTQQDKWENLIPKGYATPTLAKAGMRLNLTRQRFAFFGEVTTLGRAALMCAKREEEWDYFFCLKLNQHFRFGSLIPVLAPLDRKLKIKNAGFAVFKAPGKTLAALNALAKKELPTDYTWSTESHLPDVALQRGALIFGTLQIPPGSLFSRLLQIGTIERPENISIYALIDLDHRERPDQTEFTAFLPDIVLLETLRLTHQADFPRGIRLQYKAEDVVNIRLDARLQIENIFGKSYGFDLTLWVNNSAVETRLTLATGGETALQPWGLRGIVIEELTATLVRRFAETATLVDIWGSVRFGSVPAAGEQDNRPAFSAQLVLRGGRPALVDIALDQELAIGTFLTHCVTQGAAWPTSFIDLSFRPGSRIYYFDNKVEAIDPIKLRSGETPEDGFHVAAKIKLGWLEPQRPVSPQPAASVEVTLNLNVVTSPTGGYGGIEGSVSLESLVDFRFLQLAGPRRRGHLYIGGPSLEVETFPRTRFVLVSGINFLNQALASVHVSVSKLDDKTVLNGRIDATHTLPELGKLQCDFSYTLAPNGPPVFTINNWPELGWLRGPGELLDLVQGIRKNAAAGVGCGEIANLVFHQLLSAKFTFRPFVSLGDGALEFELKGQYEMFVSGSPTSFLKLEFPKIVAHVPFDTRYKDLPHLLSTEIGRAAEQFGKELCDRPQDLALFIAMAFGDKAIGLALEFVCKGLANPAVPQAVAAAAGALGANLAGVIEAIQKIKERMDGVQDEPPTPPDEDTPPQAPLVIARTYDATNREVKLDWQAALYAASYEILIGDESHPLARRPFTGVLSGTVRLHPARHLAPGSYACRLRAVRGNLHSAWVDAGSILKPLPQAPSLSFANDELTVIASEGAGHNCVYEVALHDPQGQTLAGLRKTGERSFAAPLPEPVAGVYTARVRVTADQQFPSDWGPAANLCVLALQPPVALQPRYQPGKISLSWGPTVPDGPSVSHQIRLVLGQVTVASEIVPAGLSTKEFVLPEGTVQRGWPYTLRLRAVAPNQISAWSQAAITPLKIPPPSGIKLMYQAGQLLALWEKVKFHGNRHFTYHASVHEDEDPHAQVSAIESTSAHPQICPPPPNGFKEGGRYRLKVTAQVAESESAEAISLAFPFVALAGPVGIVLALDKTLLLRADWTAPGLPAALAGLDLKFDIQFYRQGQDASRTILGSKSGISPPLTIGPKDGEALITGTYIVEVRSIAGDYASAWVAAAPFLVLIPPKLRKAAYADSRITLEWDEPVSTVIGYEVELRLRDRERDVFTVHTEHTDATGGIGPRHISVPPALNGRIVEVFGRALLQGEDTPAEWRAGILVGIVDPVTDVWVEYAAHTVKLVLYRQTPVNRHEIVLLAPDNAELSRSTIEGSVWQHEIQGIAPRSGAAAFCTVKICSRLDDRFFASTEVSAVLLEEPDSGIGERPLVLGIELGHSAANGETEFHMLWAAAPSPQTNGYEIVLLASDGTRAVVSVGLESSHRRIHRQTVQFAVRNELAYAVMVVQMSGQLRERASTAIPVFTRPAKIAELVDDGKEFIVRTEPTLSIRCLIKKGKSGQIATVESFGNVLKVSDDQYATILPPRTVAASRQLIYSPPHEIRRIKGPFGVEWPLLGAPAIASLTVSESRLEVFCTARDDDRRAERCEATLTEEDRGGEIRRWRVSEVIRRSQPSLLVFEHKLDPAKLNYLSVRLLTKNGAAQGRPSVARPVPPAAVVVSKAEFREGPITPVIYKADQRIFSILAKLVFSSSWRMGYEIHLLGPSGVVIDTWEVAELPLETSPLQLALIADQERIAQAYVDIQSGRCVLRARARRGEVMDEWSGLAPVRVATALPMDRDADKPVVEEVVCALKPALHFKIRFKLPENSQERGYDRYTVTLKDSVEKRMSAMMGLLGPVDPQTRSVAFDLWPVVSNVYFFTISMSSPDGRHHSAASVSHRLTCQSPQLTNIYSAGKDIVVCWREDTAHFGHHFRATLTTPDGSVIALEKARAGSSQVRFKHRTFKGSENLPLQVFVACAWGDLEDKPVILGPASGPWIIHPTQPK